MLTTDIYHIFSILRYHPENEVVEFKKSEYNFDFDDLGKYFSALSNEANLHDNDFAWLVLGVHDKTREIIGTSYKNSFESLQKLKHDFAQHTTNNNTFRDIHELTIDGKRVLLFQIPAAPKGIPVAWKGHFYARQGESLAALDMGKYDEIRRQNTQQDWSAEVIPHATINDLDKEKIRWFVGMAREKRKFPLQYNDDNILQIMNSLHLLTPDNQLRNAALLLFAKDTQKWFTTATIKCAQFYGNQVQKPMASQQIYGGSIFEMVDLAVSFVMARIDQRVGQRTHSAQVDVMSELPVQAVTEAIVNAVVHRDYTSNASVQVMLFRDRLEIWNPGTLPYGMSIEKLHKIHNSQPVNPMLANPVYLTGYIEQMGTGTTDIINSCTSIGLRSPEYGTKK